MTHRNIFNNTWKQVIINTKENNNLLRGLAVRAELLKNIFYFCGFFIIFGGCESKTVHSGKVIQVNPNDAEEFVNLSEIADSIKLIKLDTADSIIIGRISRIFIKEKYIYVSDMQQRILFVFNKEGRFVSKLDKQGQGPGEYVGWVPILIGDNEDYIDLLVFAQNKIL